MPWTPGRCSLTDTSPGLLRDERQHGLPKVRGERRLEEHPLARPRVHEAEQPGMERLVPERLRHGPDALVA